VGTSMEVMYASDGSVNPARGARGGGDGAPASQLKRTRDGELVTLDPYERVRLADGETVVSICCSGGGYGEPLERDPELVRADVAEGWITAQRARAVYGVVLDEHGRVDDEATRAARAATAGR
jgi:N-methylhydantoinase B